MKQHAVFLGPHDATLDAKHRLLIPAGLKRAHLPERDGDSFMAVVGVNEKIWLITEAAYFEKADQPLNLTPGKRQLEQDLLWFGTVHQLPIDGNGRILVPAELLDETKTGNSVTLVGASSRIEIWNRDEWRAKLVELRAARKRIAEQEENEGSNLPTPPGV